MLFDPLDLFRVSSFEFFLFFSFLAAPFDVAQDMLCAFASVTPTWLRLSRARRPGVFRLTCRVDNIWLTVGHRDIKRGGWQWQR